MNHLLQILTQTLSQLRLSVTTAESCTGGWVAKTLTDLPGSSAWFDGGFVTYSNQAKASLLGVPLSLIAAEGAVSRAVALAMARGALARTQADISLAITGIAGPDGGSRSKPVGLVWFAFASRDQAPQAKRYYFSGDREAIRHHAVYYALDQLLAYCRSGHPARRGLANE